MSSPLPVYDPDEPARLQENDWDCMVESIEWCLYAWGRAPDDDWLEQSMMAAGVVNPSVGCTDASGAATARWINDTYGADGYVAENAVGVTFDQVAQEAARLAHPLAMNGAAWYHWSGVRAYHPATDLLILANPAPGWKGVQQTMSRGQWAALGPWNMVRLTHPAAEGIVEQPPIDYTPWTDGGKVGSGLIQAMQADGVLPAQRYSTWLPLGASPPADIEECAAMDGTIYRWHLASGTLWKYRST